MLLTEAIPTYWCVRCEQWLVFIIIVIWHAINWNTIVYDVDSDLYFIVIWHASEAILGYWCTWCGQFITNLQDLRQETSITKRLFKEIYRGTKRCQVCQNQQLSSLMEICEGCHLITNIICLYKYWSSICFSPWS